MYYADFLRPLVRIIITALYYIFSPVNFVMSLSEFSLPLGSVSYIKENQVHITFTEKYLIR